ncbi:hypothetical protein HX867_19980 [Pseudomonas gingeri]|uniref:hypothetical protein n=1 Tax=Pseudomonas gingeri TaxID=117681 RepID=UPI0015A43645|nr:hypothetical protein [Pseudomonas gingeri]NVZ64384.1 hypothetical protein [Pseudomonas gingeri]NVZ75977.1 hypothetical protein [Pseudomonas gingeri]
MVQDFLAQINGTVAALTAVVGVVVLTLTSFFKIFSLYDRHWSRRHHKILKELRALETSHSPFTHYLDEAIYLESYRIASGIRANKMKADFLLRLALIGHWNRWQIRQIARFLVVSPQMPPLTLRISRWDVAGARLSLSLGLLIMVVGAVLGFAVMVKGTTLGSFYAGIGLEIAFTVVAALVMSNYNTYKVARQFKEYANDHPEIFGNEESGPPPKCPSIQSPQTCEVERAAS